MFAEYKIKKEKDIWRIIASCPFCRKTHRHGGGKNTEPILLGSRSSHCKRGDYTFYDRICEPITKLDQS